MCVGDRGRMFDGVLFHLREVAGSDLVDGVSGRHDYYCWSRRTTAISSYNMMMCVVERCVTASAE
jgi:hypothetical protein